MKAVPASPFRQRLDRFARWFFNVSPTAQIEGPPAHPAAAARGKIRVKPRRQKHHVSTTRAIRER